MTRDPSALASALSAASADEPPAHQPVPPPVPLRALTFRAGAMLFGFVLILDQTTKHIASLRLRHGESVKVIPGVFDLTLVHNPGAAFGMFGGLPDPWRQIMLSVVSLIALLVVLRFMMNEAKSDVAAQAALVAILGGAT